MLGRVVIFCNSIEFRYPICWGMAKFRSQPCGQQKEIPISRASVVSDCSNSIANLFINNRPSFIQSFDSVFFADHWWKLASGIFLNSHDFELLPRACSKIHRVCISDAFSDWCGEATRYCSARCSHEFNYDRSGFVRSFFTSFYHGQPVTGLHKNIYIILFIPMWFWNL